MSQSLLVQPEHYFSRFLECWHMLDIKRALHVQTLQIWPHMIVNNNTFLSPLSLSPALPTVGQTLPILEVEGRTLSGHLCIARYLAEKFGEPLYTTHNHNTNERKISRALE